MSYIAKIVNSNSDKATSFLNCTTFRTSVGEDGHDLTQRLGFEFVIYRDLSVDLKKSINYSTVNCPANSGASFFF